MWLNTLNAPTTCAYPGTRVSNHPAREQSFLYLYPGTPALNHGQSHPKSLQPGAKREEFTQALTPLQPGAKREEFTLASKKTFSLPPFQGAERPPG
eukprot:4564-Rhodomonas_salina.1